MKKRILQEFRYGLPSASPELDQLTLFDFTSPGDYIDVGSHGLKRTGHVTIFRDVVALEVPGFKPLLLQAPRKRRGSTPYKGKHTREFYRIPGVPAPIPGQQATFLTYLTRLKSPVSALCTSDLRKLCGGFYAPPVIYRLEECKLWETRRITHNPELFHWQPPGTGLTVTYLQHRTLLTLFPDDEPDELSQRLIDGGLFGS